MSKFLIVILASMLVAAHATNVTKCKKGQPFPLSVEVEGCSELPCDVVKGTTAVMDVRFVGTKNNISSLKTKVKAKALGITVPFDLPADVADVCANLLDGASCPIDEGEDVVYKFNFYVDKSYPDISASVQVSLDDESESIACFVADIKVKSA